MRFCILPALPCGTIWLVDRDLYLRGIDLFNRAEFYDAHEVLEDVWRPMMGQQRIFLQGLIQVAVALHHHSTGNVVGARSLLRRAAKNLSNCPETYCELKISRFRTALEGWQRALDEGTPLPPLPKLEMADQNS
jgi:predicted metal-dependent hydrolase